MGYLDEEQARRVKDWFDGTYLGSSKIKVEFVRDEVSTTPCSFVLFLWLLTRDERYE